MANVTIDAERVLNRINLTDKEIPKAKVETLIDDAITTIENELGVTIGELSGDAGSKSISVDKKYAPVITNLSAIYCICFATGGSAVGLTFNVGDVNISADSNVPPLDILWREVERALGRDGDGGLEEIAMIIATDET